MGIGKKIIALFILSLTLPSLWGQVIDSPDGNLKLSFDVNNNGTPIYSLDYKNKTVLKKGGMGFVINDSQAMDAGFKVDNIQYDTKEEYWTPVWGENNRIQSHYKEMLVQLIQKESRLKLNIRFRLFNDGLGFRYEFPVQPGLRCFVIQDEKTEFRLAGDHTAFWIPADYDSNEYPISTSSLSQISTLMDDVRKEGLAAKAPAPGLVIQTPLMLKSTDGLYINIHEAALVNYAAMCLNVDDKTFTLTSHLTPDKAGVKGYIQTGSATPWRTIVVSDDARDILASNLILNLNEPCKLTDTSWIKPCKYVGVWWEYFTGGGSTWTYTDAQDVVIGETDYTKLTPHGHHGANTTHVKEYIDFASAHGIDGILVEGWNEGWEDWASYRKDRQFLFNKAYPDFDVKELQRYAKEKGVQMVMHHETAANAADYERQLDEAFQFMVDNGYHAVKTGYVGYIIPRNEYHSSQWMNNHYIHVARRAADYKVMVNSHEAVRPTGLCRTYPNWLAQESARGGEFETMGGNDPDHTCILPFTRLKGGPMDYTPGIFETRLSYYNGEKPNERVHTTLVKQMALYMTMPSPIQMVADLPSNYARFPDAFRFIEDVAVDWDNSWYLEAEPGDYITVARKAKGQNEWFVGGITDENSRTATIPFSWLPEGKQYIATIYEDGKDADWDTNPQSYRIRKVVVTPKSVLKQKLAASGGVAISIKEADKAEMKGLKTIR